MEFRLELVPLPVADVERAKSFYADQLGFTVDHDVSPNEHFRVVQLTPEGSACSIAFGVGVVETEPGSVQGLHLVVSDIHVTRSELIDRGVRVAEITEMNSPGHPTVSYAAFTDPDGNGWTLQQLG